MPTSSPDSPKPGLGRGGRCSEISRCEWGGSGKAGIPTHQMYVVRLRILWTTNQCGGFVQLSGICGFSSSSRKLLSWVARGIPPSRGNILGWSPLGSFPGPTDLWQLRKGKGQCTVLISTHAFSSSRKLRSACEGNHLSQKLASLVSRPYNVLNFSCLRWWCPVA